MKAVMVHKPFDIQVVDIPKPEIKEDTDILIRVVSGGICGSDLGIFKGTNALATYPRIIGHEFGGIVEAVGAGVKSIKTGDCVAVDPVRPCGHCYACTHGRHNVCSTLEVVGVHRNGGFSEYVVAPEFATYKIDTAKVPKDLACLAEPYSIGVQVNHRGSIEKGDKLLVMGSGPIGICIMQVAKARGAQVMMTDLLDARLDRAKDMGADVVVNTGRESLEDAVSAFTGGEGMPVTVDSVCVPATLEQAVRLASPAGRIVSLGLLNKPFSPTMVDITKKELTICGSRLNNYRFPEVISLFESGAVTPSKLRTATYHFTDVAKAFKDIMEHPENVCKATLSFE